MRVTFGDERSYEYKIAVLSKLLDKLTRPGRRRAARRRPALRRASDL